MRMKSREGVDLLRPDLSRLIYVVVAPRFGERERDETARMNERLVSSRYLVAAQLRQGSGSSAH